jgi:hypothetical protein
MGWTMQFSRQEFEDVFGRDPDWDDNIVVDDQRIFWVSSWDDCSVEFIPDNASYGFEYGEIESYPDNGASSATWEEHASD